MLVCRCRIWLIRFRSVISSGIPSAVEASSSSEIGASVNAPHGQHRAGMPLDMRNVKLKFYYWQFTLNIWIYVSSLLLNMWTTRFSRIFIIVQNPTWSSWLCDIQPDNAIMWSMWRYMIPGHVGRATPDRTCPLVGWCVCGHGSAEPSIESTRGCGDHLCLCGGISGSWMQL